MTNKIPSLLTQPSELPEVPEPEKLQSMADWQEGLEKEQEENRSGVTDPVPLDPKYKATDYKKFQDNPLDAYDQSTYHIKLFMLPEEKVNSLPYNSSDGITIAESGVTAKIIVDELNFTSFIALNGKTRNATAVNFDLTLREFSGSTLMDNIYAASLSLGIRNYMKSPYFVEISFRHRDVETGIPVSLPELRWVWPITIRAIETDVDEGGSSYTIEGHHYNHMAQKKPHIRMGKALSLEGTVVEDVTKQLSEELIKQSEEKAVTTFSLPDLYEITFPSYNSNVPNELATYELTNANPKESTKARPSSFWSNLSAGAGSASGMSDVNIEDLRNKDAKTGKAHKASVAIDQNTSIIEAINTIITNTAKYQALVKQSDTADDEAKDGKKVKVLHKVDTKVEQLNYDVVRGDYQRKFTFEVFPYQMGTLQTTPKETVTDNSEVRYKNYKDSGLLEKHYNYLFTGKNDQILEFNMKFNQAWYVNMAPQGGLFTQSWMTNESKEFNDHFKKFQELQKEIMEATKNLPDKDLTADAANEAMKKYRDKIAASNLPVEQQAQLENTLRTRTKPRIDSEEEREKYESSLSKRTDTGTGSGKRGDIKSRFVSDYRKQEAIKNADIQTKFRLLPVTYLEDALANEQANNNTQKGMAANQGGAKEYVNSLFTQAFSGASGDLVKLDMKIKGDPYWLGPSNSAEPVPSGGKGAQVFLLFTTKTPEVPDETSGVISTRGTALNGLYGVRKVSHSFSGGLFTQEIDAVREPLVHIAQIKDL